MKVKRLSCLFGTAAFLTFKKYFYYWEKKHEQLCEPASLHSEKRQEVFLVTCWTDVRLRANTERIDILNTIDQRGSFFTLKEQRSNMPANEKGNPQCIWTWKSFGFSVTLHEWNVCWFAFVVSKTLNFWLFFFIYSNVLIHMCRYLMLMIHIWLRFSTKLITFGSVIHRKMNPQ